MTTDIGPSQPALVDVKGSYSYYRILVYSAGVRRHSNQGGGSVGVLTGLICMAISSMEKL